MITLSPDPKHQHSVYTQQPSGYQQQQTGYPQQQTGYSQRQTGYPQLPMIQNDDVATVDLEISDAFSVPRVAPDRPAARPVGRAHNTAALNGKICLKNCEFDFNSGIRCSDVLLVC